MLSRILVLCNRMLEGQWSVEQYQTWSLELELELELDLEFEFDLDLDLEFESWQWSSFFSLEVVWEEQFRSLLLR